MLNAGVLAFDATGRIKALSIADFPAPHFNGGTPAGDIGSLVVAPYTSGYNPEVYVAGLPYTAQGGLVIDVVGAIVAHVAGLPVTAVGLAASTDNPVRWVAGIPIGASGRVCIAAATPPVNLSGFSNGFSGGFK